MTEFDWEKMSRLIETKPLSPGARSMCLMVARFSHGTGRNVVNACLHLSKTNKKHE